jgi:HPr kinase/phosphorylase
VTLAVAPGRNLAVLVEAAVRNHILLTRGINSTREFISRQEAAMRQDAASGEGEPD